MPNTIHYLRLKLSGKSDESCGITSDADKEVLLVLDATTGSNAVEQAKYFNEVVSLTGIVLTKLDGTAKGGVTLAVKDVTGIPIKLVCVGEQIDDLQYFEPEAFAKALTESN